MRPKRSGICAISAGRVWMGMTYGRRIGDRGVRPAFAAVICQASSWLLRPHGLQSPSAVPSGLASTTLYPSGSRNQNSQ
jgi:hypothetical protein